VSADQPVLAPFAGTVVAIAHDRDDRIAAGEALVVLEAMKMEHRIEASAGATVSSVLVKEGQIVASDTPLVELS
jgi:biotin carboxyl carrier protein